MPHDLLVAPVVTEEVATPPVRRAVRGSAARRRRVFGTLVGGTAVTSGLALVVAPVVWVALALAVATVAYTAVVARVQHLAVRREMAVAFGAAGGAFDWDAFVAPGAMELGPEEVEVLRRDSGRLTVPRFLAAYLLGWLLAPAAVLIRLLAGDRRDLRGDGVLARVVVLQRTCRAHSLRALAVSLATTAGVGAVGSLTGVAAATPVSTSPGPAPTGDSYTVRAGDTLVAIAGAHGTSVAALVAANHLLNPDLIAVGQVLSLASGAWFAPGAAVGAQGGSYTVLAGDTLGAIAASHGTTVAALVAANHIANADRIPVGQVLDLAGGTAGTPTRSATPARSARPAPSAAPARSARPARSATPIASPSTTTYTVRAGDTIGAIAARVGMNAGVLASTNRVTNPDMISVGEVLTLVGARPPAAPAPVAPHAGALPTPARTPVATPVAAPTPVAGPLTPAPAPAPRPVAELVAAPAPPVAKPVTAPAPVAAAPPVATPVSGRASVAVATALAQVGKPYQWGGSGPSSFDCSGLTMFAWRAAGVSLPHYTVSQQAATTRITEAQLQPGDLVFYGGSAPGHVTMYIGHGQVVTADTTGTPVRVEVLTWDGTPTAFGRVG